MSILHIVNDQNFEAEVLQFEKPVLVDFYADWCPPCKAITPILEEMAEEADGEYRIVKLNVDDTASIAETFQVSSIPTLILFKEGELVERWVGIEPKARLVDGIRKHTEAASAASDH